ncbi:MAG: hypothetical protein J6R22_04740 [Alphaproteobacteria bacterium]|nr:hypothetical protein [Alphaproteobacteria bacterium]
MRRSYFITVFSVSMLPVSRLYAAGNQYLTCTNSYTDDSVECLDYGDYNSGASGSFSNGQTVVCTCNDDANQLMKFTCYEDYVKEDTENDIEGVNYAYWLESSCYFPSEDGGDSGGDDGNSVSCALGYFKKDDVCYSCATLTEEALANSGADADSIEDCFVPAGYFSDDVGTYRYDDKCFFSCDEDGTEELCSSYQ